jgi:hypothetical protein
MIIIICVACLFGDNIEDIPILRWAGPPGSRPGTQEEWLAEHPYTAFYYTLRDVHSGDGRLGNVAIITENVLAPYLEDEIDQLCQSLTTEGYTVFEYELRGGTPETLRTFLADIRDQNSIEGVLFIGNLPVAWFEVHDFGGSLTQFPIDLYYMDLDGIWLDTIGTGNGRYDGHIGNTKPEIYVGRLLPTGIGIDTVVLKRYFEKNYAFREGIMNLPARALVFVDDDWEYWGPWWAGDVSLLYPDTMNYWDPETTRAIVYRPKLDTAQAWVSVFAHSWPGGHAFAYHVGNDTLHDYYYSNEYTNQNPPTNFYNFFACSFCLYTENGYGGGRAIFNESHGIGAIGSTKSGSMLDFGYFYRPLSQGENLGEAFKYWFECIYDSVGMNFDRLCWHYGMTLLGDPFLKPTGYNTLIAENGSIAVSGANVFVNNPVTDRVNLTVNLDQAQHGCLTIYDCLGRYVGTLYDGMLDAGAHQLAFRPVDAQGTMLPNGIYLIRIAIGTNTLTRKLVKI